MKIQASKTVVTLSATQRAALKREAKRGLEFVLLMADVASANSKMSANAVATALADEFGLSRGYLNNSQKWAKDAALTLKVALCDLRATVEAMPEIRTQGDLIALSAPEEEEEAEAGDDSGDDSETEETPVTPAQAFGQAVETALKSGLTEAELITLVRSMAKANKPALKAAA